MRPSINHAAPRLPARISMTGGHESAAELWALARGAAGQWLIFRHYHHPERRRLAAGLAEACRHFQTKLLIAADESLALSLRADGVHYPAAQLARRPFTPHPRRGWLASAAVHNRPELLRAAKAGADCALLAPALAAPSGGQVLGAARFAALAHETALPLFALGGLNAVRFARLRGAGAAGWAAVRGAPGAAEKAKAR